VGKHVHVAGTAPIMPDGADPPPGPYGQAKRCLQIIAGALLEVGATPADVVRTRIYLTAAEHWDEVGRAHGELFGDVRPASAMVVVASLLDPRWLVEIEADALIG
jgi:enamine deaminase RidA (YjgF/YER057c/UK114 family)